MVLLPAVTGQEPSSCGRSPPSLPPAQSPRGLASREEGGEGAMFREHAACKAGRWSGQGRAGSHSASLSQLSPTSCAAC